MAPKTIILKGDPLRKEAVADEILTPGMLVNFDSDQELQKHPTAGGNAQKMFVVEQEFLGDDIDDTYAIGDQVQYVVARPGDEIYAWATTSQTIEKGDALESAGNGYLQKHTAPSVVESGSATVAIYHNAIVGYAAEDKTTTTAEARIKIEAA